MLKMSTVAAVEGYGGPLVAQNFSFRTPRIHHGLNRQHHAFGQFDALALLAEIRDLRRFVQLGPDSVSDKFSHYAEAGGFHIFLDRRTHMADRVANLRLLDAFVQRRFRYFEQLLQLVGQ